MCNRLKKWIFVATLLLGSIAIEAMAYSSVGG